MPLWMSSGSWGECWPGDELVDLSGDVAFEAADGFASGLAVGDAPVDVGACALVPAQPRYDDGVERGVGLPVAASVETASLRLAGRHFDRTDAAEGGERCLAGETLRVVADSEEQRGGGVGSDALAVEQAGGVGVDGIGDVLVEVVDLGGQRDDPVGEQPEGVGG